MSLAEFITYDSIKELSKEQGGSASGCSTSTSSVVPQTASVTRSRSGAWYSMKLSFTEPISVLEFVPCWYTNFSIGINW